MNTKRIAGGLVIGIICASAICVAYDLREYEQFALEENIGFIGVTGEMSSGYCEFLLNFSRHLVIPEYQFESFDITEVVVKILSISTNTTETIYVDGMSYGGLEYWNDTMTQFHDIILSNISLRYVYFISIRMWSPSIPVYVYVSAHFTVKSVFEKPPKHTIAETLLSIDPEILIFIGAMVVFLPIIALSRRLSRE